MNRKYLNYAIFLAIVAVVVGIAVRHSRHMAYLVDSMAGPDQQARVSSAKELVKGEQFMDAITGESIGRRIRIVQALEDWGDKDATTQMVAFLKDPDRPVRDRLVLGLIRVSTKNADNLQAVVNGIQDGDGNVRKACIAVLQVMGQDDPDAAMALLQRALPDTAPATLTAALELRNKAVADQIIEKTVALMKAGAPARPTGGDVLGALKHKREQCVAALLPQLADKDDGICSGAASALGKVGSATPVPELITAMAKRSPQVRRVAIGAIALIGAPSGEAALREALNTPDDDNEARAQAAAGLGRIATPTAIAALVRAMEDDDLKVQVAAVDALSRAGSPALAPVMAAVRSANANTRVRACQALGGIASTASNGALIAALNDASSRVRVAAATALGFEGNSAAVGALAAKLADKDGAIGTAAAEALARIGAPARATLARGLVSGDQVAFLCASALAKQGVGAVPSVLEAARTSPGSGKWATVALAGMRSAESLEALRTLAASSNPETRESASLALRRLSLQ